MLGHNFLSYEEPIKYFLLIFLKHLLLLQIKFHQIKMIDTNIEGITPDIISSFINENVINSDDSLKSVSNKFLIIDVSIKIPYFSMK